MIITKPFQGLKRIEGSAKAGEVVGDDHYQTLSGIETKKLKANLGSLGAMIITKPFQGLKRSSVFL